VDPGSVPCRRRYLHDIETEIMSRTLRTCTCPVTSSNPSAGWNPDVTLFDPTGNAVASRVLGADVVATGKDGCRLVIQAERHRQDRMVGAASTRHPAGPGLLSRLPAIPSRGDHPLRLLHRRPARRHESVCPGRHRARRPTRPHPRRHRAPDEQLDNSTDPQSSDGPRRHHRPDQVQV